jgi:hypothetical protein
MDQEIDQPIDVIAVFQKGRMVPVRFRWDGRVIKIARVTGRWKTSEGKFKIRHFAVIDKNSQFCQLSYRERTGEWFGRFLRLGRAEKPSLAGGKAGGGGRRSTDEARSGDRSLLRGTEIRDQRWNAHSNRQATLPACNLLDW